MKNNIDLVLNILWISDIHYKEKYKDSPTIKDFLASFNKKVTELNQINPIDYILISGDIANRAKVKDYNEFKENLLSPLLILFGKNKPKVILVPGNHDVDRTRINTKLPEFVENIISYDKRKSFMNDKSFFYGIFENYSTLYKDYNELNICKLQNKTNDDNSIIGFYIDKSKKTIFIVLNSAWYSLGNEFTLDYLKNVISKINFNNDEKLKMIDKSLLYLYQQFGNQMIGGDFINYDSIKEEIKKYNDYLVVTTMHHPLPWISWNERFNLTGSNNKFRKIILNNTDILLTGHEHIPSKDKPEYLFSKKLLHIDAGCFIFGDRIFDEENNSDVWFSTLKININKRNITQQKFIYKEEKKEWNSKKKIVKRLNKKYKKTLTISRKKDINDTISALKDGELLKAIVNKESNTNNVEMKSFDNYLFYNKILYTLVPSKNGTIFGTNIIELKKLIDKYQPNKVKHFYLDIRHKNYENYIKKPDRLYVLETIKNDVDFQFDKFRHNFFSTLNEQDIIKYKKLKMVCKIYPFWELESLIYNE